MGFTRRGVRKGCGAWPPRRYALAGFVCGVGRRLLLAGGVAVVVAVSPVAGQTLDDELAGLLASYPQLAASRADIASASDGIERAFADYLPQVSLFADYGYETTDSPATRAVRGSSFDTQRDTATPTITENLGLGRLTPEGLGIAAATPAPAE